MDTGVAIEIGVLVAQGAALLAAVRALWNRQDRMEHDLDRKLNNGIRTEIAKMHTAIALIQQQINMLCNNDPGDGC